MNAFLPFLAMFATPLGSLINKAIAGAAASAVAVSVSHGNPIGDVTQVVGTLAFAASSLISGFAATQGVKIAVINADDLNGVKVVPASADAPTTNRTLPETVKRGGPHG